MKSESMPIMAIEKTNYPTCLTKREFFAIKLMCKIDCGNYASFSDMASIAVQQADALIKELDK